MKIWIQIISLTIVIGTFGILYLIGYYVKGDK